MMPRFYLMRNTARANIQGVGMWLQIGATVMGIAPRWWWNHADPRQRRATRRLGLVIAAPPEFCATRALLMMEIGRWEFGYRSRGEVDRRDIRYRETGWKFLASLVLALALAACSAAQVETAKSYQDKIAAACAVAVPLAGAVPSVGIYITAACASEAMIAKLALNPTSLAWLEDLIAKAKSKA